MSLKYILYTFICYIWPKRQTQKGSRAMFTFQLLLLFRNWTLCRCLLVRCSLSLSPTLFIHFWTSTADGTEYLHLSAPTGSLLVFSCIITVGCFSEGHIYGTTTANRSGSGSHSSGGGGWPWRDATQAGTSKRGLSRDPPKQNSPERRDNHHNRFLSKFVCDFVLFSYY